jgi:carbamate kinase
MRSGPSASTGRSPEISRLRSSGPASRPTAGSTSPRLPYAGAEPYPLDVLDAGTQGVIGYLIQQELRSLLPPEQQVATLLTMIVVDPDDLAFTRPAKFVGPVYAKDAADALAAEKGWTFRQDGTAWRRVVPSPQPRRILEIEPISWLLDRGAVVICAGGEGIPTMFPSSAPGDLLGVEAVVDKDLASELLAEDVDADLFVMATDVDGVYLDWGTPEQRRLDTVTPQELAGHAFAAGSMGPKVQASTRFAAKAGNRAAIGSLADIAQIVAGTAGTNVAAPTAHDEAVPGSYEGKDTKKDQVQTGEAEEARS